MAKNAEESVFFLEPPQSGKKTLKNSPLFEQVPLQTRGRLTRRKMAGNLFISRNNFKIIDVLSPQGLAGSISEKEGR
jgi:hypothetical protein